MIDLSSAAPREATWRVTALRMFAEREPARRSRQRAIKTLLARGEGGLQFGWPDAAQHIAEAKFAIERIEDY